MKTINRVTLLGHVGQDPDIQTYGKNDTDQPFATFSMATDEAWKNEKGDWVKKPDWHQIVVFDPHLVQLVNEKVRKGTRLFLEGTLKVRKWEDKEGKYRESATVQVTPFEGKIRIISQPKTEEKKS